MTIIPLEINRSFIFWYIFNPTTPIRWSTGASSKFWQNARPCLIKSMILHLYVKNLWHWLILYRDIDDSCNLISRVRQIVYAVYHVYANFFLWPPRVLQAYGCGYVFFSIANRPLYLPRHLTIFGIRRVPNYLCQLFHFSVVCS